MPFHVNFHNFEPRRCGKIPTAKKAFFSVSAVSSFLFFFFPLMIFTFSKYLEKFNIEIS